MAAMSSPVKVGTRGTIASLVSQEIEYFKKLELGYRGGNQKPKTSITDVASTSGSSKHKSGSSSVMLKKKKKVAGNVGGFLPSICSAVEIRNTSCSERITGVSYKNLRTDGKKLSQD